MQRELYDRDQLIKQLRKTLDKVSKENMNFKQKNIELEALLAYSKGEID